MTDARINGPIDALLLRLDVPAEPDPGFVTASLDSLMPAARRARRQDASAFGRLRRDIVAALRFPSVGQTLRVARVAVFVVIVLLGLALLILVVGGRRHVPPPFGPAANGTIAYVANNHLFLADSGGTHSRQVTFGDGNEVDPAFSRDGTRLAWRHYPKGNYGNDNGVADAVVADADGSHVIVIARDVAGMSHVAWSPDGRDVAFSGSINGGPDSGWIAPSDGSAPPSPFTTIAGAWDPAWAPDGRRFAIGAAGGLFVMNRDGSGARRINHRDFTEIGERGEIAEWSPDGTRLLFTAFTGDGEADFEQEVYIVGLDGASEVLLSRNAARGRDGVWSPDGTRIAYMRTSGTGRGPYVWITDPDGTHNQILSGYFGWFQPIWSPDGTKIVVTDDRPGPNDVEGPAVRVILDVAGKEPPIVIPAAGVTPNDVPDWAAAWQRLAPN